jgi:hypothetical protein
MRVEVRANAIEDPWQPSASVPDRTSDGRRRMLTA